MGKLRRLGTHKRQKGKDDYEALKHPVPKSVHLDKILELGKIVPKGAPSVSVIDRIYYVPLIDKYGTDYESMFKDIKLNYRQMSPGQLRAGIQRMLKHEKALNRQKNILQVQKQTIAYNKIKSEKTKKMVQKPNEKKEGEGEQKGGKNQKEESTLREEDQEIKEGKTKRQKETEAKNQQDEIKEKHKGKKGKINNQGEDSVKQNEKEGETTTTRGRSKQSECWK